jgi:hypothetical protein
MGNSKLLKGLAPALAILISVTVLAGCSPVPDSNNTPATTEDATFQGISVMVFQSPNCDCCGNYKEYLREHGFQVETTYIDDTSSIKREYNIAPTMTSCHTMVFAEGYFVEGHVPVEAIGKLLAEKPDIDGIILPGMPSGSPGMPEQQTEAFIIYALSEGELSEFMTIGG